MPTRAVNHHEGMNMFGKSTAEVLKINTHDSGIKTIKQKGMFVASAGSDGTDDVGTFEAILSWERRT